MKRQCVELACVVLAAALLAGCSSSVSVPAKQVTIAPPPSGSEGGSSPGWLEGSVTEVIDVGDYRYLCVNADHRSFWLAATISGVAVGDIVEYQKGLLMRDFQSPSLSRRFPEIRFVDRIRVKERTPVAVSTVKGLPSGHPAVPRSSRSNQRTLPAPKKGSLPILPDTETIHDIEARTAVFSGKRVSVVGLVARVNRNIMGRNWIHLLDDRGGELVATTSADVPLGSVVLARGRISTDKTFNGGYYMPFLLEEAQCSVVEAGHPDPLTGRAGTSPTAARTHKSRLPPSSR
ncbi:MAG: hypothetical protein WAO20_06340 [Acidobacteriota bacterium]